MAVLFRTHYKLAKESIARNRTRSFLTCLGIAVGVASITLIMSLTGSIRSMVAGQVNAMGSDLIVVRPAKHADTVGVLMDGLTASNQYMTSGLSLTDVKAINKLDDVSAAAPIAAMTATLSTDDRTVTSANVIGTTRDLSEIQNLRLMSGTFLSDKVHNNAVVGKDLALKLFGTSSEAVGKTFMMGDQRFIVVGMLEEMDDPINFNNIDFNNAMLMDAEYLAEIGSNFQVQQISVRAKTTDKLEGLKAQISGLLEKEKSGDKNFEVLGGNEISHPAGSLLAIISGMLTLVAGVSLIVGGIGVMNILLVSVAERTREIGIRKAVGASSFNILMQFMFEALMLSLSGGTLGLILGYVIAFLISVVTPFAPYISVEIIVVTLSASVLIGVIFGIYPAVKAALKNPIDSLRYYR